MIAWTNIGEGYIYKVSWWVWYIGLIYIVDGSDRCSWGSDIMGLMYIIMDLIYIVDDTYLHTDVSTY